METFVLVTPPAMRSCNVKIVRQIYAITTMALQMGYMPTDPDDIMAMLKEVPATRAEICNLARKNLLEWIYFQDCGRSREEYRANMNKSMAKYLQQTPEVDRSEALGNRLWTLRRWCI